MVVKDPLFDARWNRRPMDGLASVVVQFDLIIPARDERRFGISSCEQSSTDCWYMESSYHRGYITDHPSNHKISFDLNVSFGHKSVSFHRLCFPACRRVCAFTYLSHEFH
jgi:hypothetical protein